MKNIKIIVLFLIVILGGLLRFYKLDQVPPSLNWDEIAAGYNAYTIANWGADEYGNKFPIVFKSFGDDKHPIHIYLTALVVKIFGLSDYSARASSALVGTLSVLAIYFLAKKLFKNEIVGFFSALFLAVSPYHLQYSRGLWETNFALSFFLLGLALFYYGIERKNWLIPLSFASFGLSFFSYHSAKIVIPPVAFLLCAIHFKDLIKNKKLLIVSILVVLFFGALVIKEPRILGFARINQTRFSKEETKKYGGLIPTYIHNYKGYFKYSYLFQSGDQGPRASVKTVGEFYKIDLILAILGLVVILLTKKWQAFFILITWLALSPVPGAISATEPSAIRGIFMIGPVILFSAQGAASLISFLNKNTTKTAGIILIVLFLGREVGNYLKYYYTSYAQKEAIEWQYGMKQIVGYLKERPDYFRVYMDKIRQQPYIFFLFYFKTPLPELLKTVKYDESESKSYNTVVSFDKYRFGNWDIIDSRPDPGIIYIMTPSYYTGLRYGSQFDVKKLIKYSNGNDAFYIVEGNI
ncbi:hypothetical protein COY29_05200 [Candidatus Woesebacteria bacterium CG_4_10_14_0_2_um_filter_39_14]|uniref:Glycosyltransferase RgtA/B/C/D-like domain-containing protein n=2 Tax=Candidatus Woeseibacteriota TaxID=1752722 RepID=A0A2M7AQW8_9BACT|nr:MAG: hypothetical protein COS80_00265 [Candidatus Woesebacteria bacterium CG06_land_8_20_14_3_00_39_27]PIZ47441.1 MAG: hypothetical protein COY29_05200 [Candidatus Woesebacteria bacterium CG_4_10_14_0_2_um_filter_39_14]